MTNKNDKPIADDRLLADRIEQEMLSDIKSLESRGQIRLPKQDELAERYGVSLRTIRTVVDRLKKDRIIHSIKGKGTYIAKSHKSDGNILLIVDDPTHPYTSMVISVANQVLLGRGLNPVMGLADNLGRSSGDLAGALVISCSEKVIQFLKSSQLPYCAINDVMELERRHSVVHQTVRCNNYLWSYLATKLILMLGKWHPIFFRTLAHTRVDSDHHLGVMDALGEVGLNVDDASWITVPRESDPGVDEFCVKTRRFLEGFFGKYGEDAGIVDFSGTITYPQSSFYHRAVEGTFAADDVVATDFVESSKAFNAKSYVQTSMKALISRAVDIVIGEEKPYSICETHDHIVLRLNENGLWNTYDWQSFFDSATDSAGIKHKV